MRGGAMGGILRRKKRELGERRAMGEVGDDLAREVVQPTPAMTTSRAITIDR